MVDGDIEFLIFVLQWILPPLQYLAPSGNDKQLGNIFSSKGLHSFAKNTIHERQI